MNLLKEIWQEGPLKLYYQQQFIFENRHQIICYDLVADPGFSSEYYN